MEFYRKSILIFLIAFISCSQLNHLKSSKQISFTINKIDIWFDAMPKIESPSLLHFNIDFILKNLTDKKIEIDSLNFEVYSDKNLVSVFYPVNESQIFLNPFQVEIFNYNLSTTGSNELLKSESRKSRIYMNLFFKSSGNSFNEKFLAGEKEIQVVY